MSYQTLSYEVENNIALVGFGKNENKSMTTLTRAALEEFKLIVEEIKKGQKSKEIKALLFFSHKPGVFLAGVDVSLISSLKTELEASNGAEEGQKLYNEIEDLKIPTAALVDGVCLGGGLELALSCDRIYISDNPKTALGLPEVMLGVLPGFGGTYRLPRKIGLPMALDHILTGKQARGKKALKLGLADGIFPKERMLELAKEKILKPLPKQKQSFEKTFQKVATDNFFTRKIIFQKARESVLKQTKGFYPAPLKILEVMESGAGKKRDSYLSLEAQAFGVLAQTVQSKNLQHIFFLTDNSKKLDNKETIKTIERSAVLGAGVMGGGIAWLMANNNQSPIMKDIGLEGLELGLKQAADNFKKALKRKRLSADDYQRKMRSITATMDYTGFKNVDLVVEAVVENMDVKKKVFAELEGHVKEDCLITSNTSSLSITEMSSALKNPRRFAGLHFFNPVHKMPLVEIVTHKDADPQKISQLYKWVLDAKKTPVVVKDGPGFLVNRILAPYLNEAGYLIEEGVSIDDIDQAALNFGMPMGPCRLMDEVGLDVCEKVGKIMEAGLGARAKACALSKKVQDSGALGKKNKKGFYIYDEAGKQTGKNEDVIKLFPQEKKKYDEVTLQMRLFLPMINEAAFCLTDGIVDGPETVDIGMIYGIGFPPFRGGLLRYADKEGLARLAEAIKRFASEVDEDRYRLAPLIEEYILAGRGFYAK